MKSKENLVFVGMMGSGKSSIGLLIAKKLKVNFIDIDKEIEKELGLSISKFFEIKEPIVDFPDPIIPIKIRFFFDFISFFIEKT